VIPGEWRRNARDGVADSVSPAQLDSPARDSRVIFGGRKVRPGAGNRVPCRRRRRWFGWRRGITRSPSDPEFRAVPQGNTVARAGPRGPSGLATVPGTNHAFGCHTPLQKSAQEAVRARFVFLACFCVPPPATSHPGCAHAALSLRLLAPVPHEAVSQRGADPGSAWPHGHSLQTRGHLERGGLGMTAVSRRKINGT